MKGLVKPRPVIYSQPRISHPTIGAKPGVALGFALKAHQGFRNIFDLRKARSHTNDPLRHICRKPANQILKPMLEPPGACNDDLDIRSLAHSLFKEGQATEVLGLVAKLWVQYPVEVKEQRSHVARLLRSDSVANGERAYDSGPSPRRSNQLHAPPTDALSLDLATTPS